MVDANYLWRNYIIAGTAAESSVSWLAGETMMKQKLRGLVTVRQAVARTGRSETDIRNKIRRGELKVIRFGYNLFLSERDVAKLTKPKVAA